MYQVKLILEDVVHIFKMEANDIQQAEYMALDEAMEMHNIQAHEWDEIETIYITEE